MSEVGELAAIRSGNMSKRILLVEDDPLNSYLLCAVLENAGLVVQAVTDGAHVLKHARQFAPDLVTMDINLPNISGLEIIQELQADPKLRQIPILAVTGYVGIGEEALIRKAGAKEFLAKPISMRTFLAAVNRLLSDNTTQTQPRFDRKPSPTSACALHEEAKVACPL